MRTSLAWRISGAYLVLILSILLGLGLYVASFARASYLGQLEAQLAAEASIGAGEVALALAAGPQADLQALAARLGAGSGSRVTLIGPDGTVLGDSAESPAYMENHANRPELATALRGERGTSARRSDTVGYDMLYVAVPIREDGRIRGVARAALPLAAVERAVGALLAGLGPAIAVAAVAAALLAAWLGRTTTVPIKRLTRLAGRMAGGDLEARLRFTSRDEVGELGAAFNQMADRLQQTIGTISTERTRLAAILETVADGLVIVDEAGRVLQINPAAERLLRIDAARALGEAFITVGRDHELADLLARPAGGERLLSLGLPRREVRAVAAAVPGTGGQRVLLLQDLTELRRLERARRELVANVSHELRTPLAAMKAIVETLEDGALDDPPAARQFLGRLHDEVDRLAELMRELLELSRIESGAAEIRPTPLLVEPLLRSVAERLEPLARRAGLELRVDAAPGLPPALADAERIGQVIANLLHNAIKFTPPGGSVALRATAEGLESGAGDATRPPTAMLAVSVADTGVGVPPEDLERIFERFYKTDRSRSGGGTGLGLAIAKHVVHAHGGRIWAESGGSGGATFSFTLPIVQPEASEVGGRESVDDHPHAAVAQTGSRRPTSGP